MAPFNIKNTLGLMQGWLSKSGYARDVRIGEPKAPPSQDLSAAVYMNNVSVLAFYLNGGTKELHTVTIRLYKNMLGGDEEVEVELANALSNITSKLLGDFDLGGNIRNIDAAGEHGTSLSGRWGYIDVGGTMYRMVDITVPLVVDDSATAAA